MDNINRIIKCLLYLLVIYLIISLNLDLIFVYAQTGKDYAGYYYTHIVEYGRWGVEDNIYTADMHNIPYTYYSGGAEWICIILSYSPLYWIQVGYQKIREGFGTYVYYYVETNDTTGYNITRYSGLTISSTHLYRIINENVYSDPYNPIDPHYWLVKVDPDSLNQPVSKEIYVSPYEGVDMQAFIEIHDSDITVDHSHFYNLKRYDPYYGWILWDTHVGNYTDVFYLEEVSDYEFEAWTI